MQKKLLSQWMLSCFFILVFCPRSFSQAAECDTAAASCTAKCGELQAQDQNSGGPQETYFKRKCEDSCSNGVHNCQLQDSQNGCDTFYYHCVEGCPWRMTNNIDGQSPLDSNVFNACAQACAEGQKSCQASGQPSPRKRTGPFDACVEAQEACYADCGVAVPMDDEYMPIDNSDYPQRCAKACFMGVASCQADKTPAQCEDYFENCDKACPDSVTDENGDEVSGDYIDMLCHDSCEKGEDYCTKILQK